MPTRIFIKNAISCDWYDFFFQASDIKYAYKSEFIRIVVRHLIVIVTLYITHEVIEMGERVLSSFIYV